MERTQLQEILSCLGQDRTKFYYQKDHYALMLLSYFIGRGMKINEIKNSKWKRLLDKPLIKNHLKKAGSQHLCPEQLYPHWNQDSHCYLLTLGSWGSSKGRSRFYNQTSRPGLNLVLQLNFSEQHNCEFRKLIKPVVSQPFSAYGHPVSQKHHTLGWARIDLDIIKNEALIEEIQTDWIRLVGRAKQYLEKHGEENVKKQRWKPSYIRGIGCGLAELEMYCKKVLKQHTSIWQEAMLSAAIAFLRDEVGIRNIFYHTFDSGCQAKRISGTRPPRSLYTRLPEKFCFEKTSRSPSFLLKGNNRKIAAQLRKGQDHFFLLTV
jgi:hypothetical protein